MPLLQSIENRLIDPVAAHQLPRIGDDVALILGERGGISLRAQQIDRRLRSPGRAGGANLRSPDVMGVALAYRSQDRVREQPRFDDGAATVELDELQHSLGKRRAVQQHAERPADLAKDADNIVDDIVVLRRNVGLAGDRWHARHVSLPLYSLVLQASV